MQNFVAKKIFAVASAAAMLVPFAAPLLAHAAVHAAGTNVSDSSGTVWMIMPDGTRRAYTSAGAFLSYGFNSWSQVVAASAEDLALPQGSFIPPQDGSIICSDRGADKGTCYEISNSQKFGFTSAAVFTGLGFSFTNSMAGDVSWMASGATLINNTTAAHLPGTLVNNQGTVQLVGNSGLLGIPDVATFNSWGYSFGKVVPANAADQAMTQTGVMAARVAGQLSPTALAVQPGCTSNCTPVVSGNVTASLSSDTPAAGTLVSSSQLVGSIYPSQTGADIAHFTFSGTGTVTQVVIHRLGVSADTSLNNVYLYMGNNRITDPGSFSNSQVTFSNSNGLFTVNGSAEISVRVDVAGGTSTSGQTVGAQLASFAVANNSPMTTAISGNLFQLASVSNLASANVTSNNGVNNPPHSGINDVNPGANVTLWSYNVSVGQRAVNLTHIQFKQIGSISPTAITNLHLFVDGASVGPAASITNNGAVTNVVVFDLTGSPLSLNTGNHTIELHGDVVGGSSYTFDFSLQTSADVVLVDPNYNVNIQLTDVSAQLFQLAPGVSQISSGTVSVQQDPAFTATQFVQSSSGVILGSWTMKAYGEDVKVQDLTATIKLNSGYAIVNDGFNNLTLTVNGGSVGSSLSALQTVQGSTLPASGVYTFGSGNLFTIPAGTTVTVQLKGDNVYTTTSGSTYTSETATLNVPASAFQGVNSYALTPATLASYTGQTLSTTSSGAALAKNTAYANQTVSNNLNAQHLGSYVIQASNADGVDLNSVVVGWSTTNSTLNNNGTTTGQTTTIINHGLNNIYVVVTYPGGSWTGQPQQPASTNSFSPTGATIPANQTGTVDVYADTTAATGTVMTTLYANAVGHTSRQTITGTGFASSAQNGQQITVGSGVLTSVALSAAASPASSFVAGGSSNQPVGTYIFYANSTAGVTINELGFTVPNSGAITSVQVPVNGISGTMASGNTVSTSVLIGGLSIPVPFGSSGINVPVTVTYSKASVSGQGGVADGAVTLNLAHVKYSPGTGAPISNSSTAYAAANSGNSGDATGVIGSLGKDASAMYLTGSFPTLSVTSTNVAGLALSEQHLLDVTMTPNAAGNVTASSVSFTLSQSGVTSTPTLADPRLAVGSNTITGSMCTAGTALTGSTTTTSLASAVTIACTLPTNYSVSPSGVTFSLYGTLAGALQSSGQSSVTTALAAASTFSWVDTTGDNSVITGNANTLYLSNYPTQSWYLHN